MPTRLLETWGVSPSKDPELRNVDITGNETDVEKNQKQSKFWHFLKTDCFLCLWT